ncbi:MAG: alpha-1,3-galactosidase B [Chitinophagales bacterium]|nr:alpha-1,3-galactosidase B [Chitinophagales bacterium]
MFGTANAQDTISVSDFGYVVNSKTDAVPFVKKAIAACRNKKKPVLIFPRGRYDFWPEQSASKQYYESNTDVIPVRKCPILIEGFKNLTIDFKESDLVFHGMMQPITVDSSENVLIKNVSIDWDVPVMGQGKIIAVGENYIDVEISPESPYEISNGKIFFVGEGWRSELSDIMEFDKETKFIAQGCGDGCLGNDFYSYTGEEISRNNIRIKYKIARHPEIGNYLALRHSARDHAGTFIRNSKNIRLENLNMFQNAGLGILSQYSENLSFRNVQCVPNPKKGRVFAGHDDGLHFSNCKGQITVDHCRFAGLMDDPINVHGTSVRVVKKLGDRKLLCKFIHDQSYGFVWARPGEKIGFIEHEFMNTAGFGIVESFAPVNPREFEISFTGPLPSVITGGDALENLTWSPDVIIKNSFFGSCRARGILVTTPGKVVIEKNIFESSGSAILIAGDANYWYESGAVKDVMIRNNTFNAPCLTSMFQFCEAIISICPEIPTIDRAKPFHRNIRIEKNTFNPFDYPVLYAKSVQRLIFLNNYIKRSVKFKPWHPRKQMITLESCQKVRISQNKFFGEVLGKNVKLINTLRTDLQLDMKQSIVIEN